MLQFEHVLVDVIQPVAPPYVVFRVRKLAPAAASHVRVNRAEALDLVKAEGFIWRGNTSSLVRLTLISPERFLRPLFADRCAALSTALAGWSILCSPGCDRIAVVR